MLCNMRKLYLFKTKNLTQTNESILIFFCKLVLKLFLQIPSFLRIIIISCVVHRIIEGLTLDLKARM